MTQDNLLEVMYVICGLISIYMGIRALTDKEQKSKAGTAIFWLTLGVVMGFGKWIPSLVSGILIVVMAIPAMLNFVKQGSTKSATNEYKEKMADKHGNKLFIPAFTMGVFAVVFAIFLPKLGALVGLGAGTIIAAMMVYAMTKDSPAVILNEGRRMLDDIGPLSMLPLLLASLGAIFTTAGVGDVIAKGVGTIVPQGNLFLGIVLYAVGMVIFTMIMGNAYAAFAVITTGIGVPFVIKLGVNPNVVGMLAMTCGFCGTLMTPMAANFNIVPVAILEMKDKYGVIKKQIPIALTMLVVQILIMYFFGRM